MRRRWIRWGGLAAVALVAAACVPDAGQDALKPAGPMARSSFDLAVPVFIIAGVIFVIVEGLLVWFSFRYRHRAGRTELPAQVHGNTRLEIAWTILPAVILAGVAVPTVATIFELARDPGPGAVEINVIGHQFWWEFDYGDEGVITANVLHIPEDRPIRLTVCAAGAGYEGVPAASPCQPGGTEGPMPASVGFDVIHSFWVPQLAGTQDAVPGRANTLILQADEPGTYSGQCKEFCGLSHAYMRFKVVVHTADDYARWLADQGGGGGGEGGSPPATGANLFLNGQCIACHAIGGLETANGQPLIANGGPNLTHFASRECFAGCMFETNAENLRKWLENPPAMKAGSWMPNYNLSPEEIEALTAYLLSLT